MPNLWRLTSWDLTMFTTAQDYSGACKEFKKMLKKVIINSKDRLLLDEIIEIAPLNRNGIANNTESGLEFSEEWLKDLGLGFDIFSIV